MASAGGLGEVATLGILELADLDCLDFREYQDIAGIAGLTETTEEMGLALDIVLGQTCQQLQVAIGKQAAAL